ncbi:hypothetical protein [Colwellia sp. Arc7-D]|uniref:hypothetical protein n=1 Tax=Colwellia sp. Arc7-D TaxID=2161872 RepID=UPI000D3C165A|nr:hypothetical protein [Colwellia sp. Arc7-D]AWB57856.1 hypothetical protein DBO93_09915 [Colwellia sp. Arc7-D]
MRLDQLSLDEMVQGLEVADDNWEILLRQPDAEEKWADAINRREHLNAFCRLAVKWPAIIFKYKKVKSFTKKNINSPLISIFSSGYEPFSAVLSADSHSDEDSFLSIEVKWGKQQIVELDNVTSISFKSDTVINIFYSYNEGDGVISSNDSWCFKPEEGAVLLTFVEGDCIGNDFESILSQAKSVASVVLLPL